MLEEVGGSVVLLSIGPLTSFLPACADVLGVIELFYTHSKRL